MLKRLRVIRPNLWNFQRVLHILAATQEVPRHTRLHSRGSTRVLPTSRGAPFPHPISRGGILSLCSGKNPRRCRRISRGGALHRKGERNSRVGPPFQESPRWLSPFQEKLFSLHCLDFQAEDRHTMVARGTALWESLVGKPGGKASRERHRSLDPREGKRDTAATAREESARANPHSRRGLSPLGRLQKYPKIHVSTGGEC